MFTRSFEIRIVLIRSSFFSSSFAARIARRFLFLRRILSLNLFIPRNALSEIEKSIERIMRARAIINKYEGMSSIRLNQPTLRSLLSYQNNLLPAELQLPYQTVEQIHRQFLNKRGFHHNHLNLNKPQDKLQCKNIPVCLRY